jgi:hypothetical protein
VPDSPVAFHRLKLMTDGADVLVARSGTDDYVVLPSDGGALLERLTAGMTPSEATGWYRETYRESVDIDDFLSSMNNLGFIRSPGDATAEPLRTPVRLQRLGGLVFGRMAITGYLAIACGWLVLMAAEVIPPPHTRDVFFTSSLTLVQLFLVFGQTPWIFLHEGAHMLAGRRLGLRSTLAVSNRLHVIAFETRMDGLVGVPRSKRYLPFLAGMIVDVVVVAILSMIGQLARNSPGAWGLAGRLMVASVVPLLVRLSYQFLLYLRTDIYFVISTALGCNDLHGATQAIVRDLLRRATRRNGQVIDLNQWTARDRAVARWYSPFFVLGVSILLAIWILVFGPILVNFITLAIEGMASGSVNSGFVDSAIFVLLVVAQFTLAGVLAWRSRRASRHPKNPTPHHDLEGV